jgi:hypothetical protein
MKSEERGCDGWFVASLLRLLDGDDYRDALCHGIC